MSYNIGAGDVVFYTATGTNAAAHNTGDFTFDMSAFTLAQLQGIILKASYTAAVVAVPVTVLNLDSWCIEVNGVI